MIATLYTLLRTVAKQWCKGLVCGAKDQLVELSMHIYRDLDMIGWLMLRQNKNSKSLSKNTKMSKSLATTTSSRPTTKPKQPTTLCVRSLGASSASSSTSPSTTSSPLVVPTKTSVESYQPKQGSNSYPSWSQQTLTSYNSYSPSAATTVNTPGSTRS